jgi:hypothetical protein
MNGSHQSRKTSAVGRRTGCRPELLATACIRIHIWIHVIFIHSYVCLFVFLMCIHIYMQDKDTSALLYGIFTYYIYIYVIYILGWVKTYVYHILGDDHPIYHSSWSSPVITRVSHSAARTRQGPARLTRSPRTASSSSGRLDAEGFPKRCRKVFPGC